MKKINKKRIEVIKGEVERLNKQSRDETEMLLKEVKGQFMGAMKHQEKLIQTNKDRIASGRKLDKVNFK